MFGFQWPTLSRHHPQPAALEPELALPPFGDLSGQITAHNEAELVLGPSMGCSFKRGDGVGAAECLVDADPWVIDGLDQGLEQLATEIQAGIVAFQWVVASPGGDALKVIQKAFEKGLMPERWWIGAGAEQGDGCGHGKSPSRHGRLAGCGHSASRRCMLISLRTRRRMSVVGAGLLRRPRPR